MAITMAEYYRREKAGKNRQKMKVKGNLSDETMGALIEIGFFNLGSDNRKSAKA